MNRKEENPCNAEKSVANNIVVLGVISKFLDFSSLKELRSVNSTWKIGLTTTLKKKSCIVLKMRGSNSKSEIEKFVQDLQELQPINSIQIIMSTLSPHPSFCGDVEKEQELINDILQKLSHCLEHLEIGQKPYEECTDFETYFDFLISPTFFLRPSLSFPKMIKLSIRNSNRHDYEKGAEGYTKLFKSLYKSAPNIKEISVKYLSELINCVINPLKEPETCLKYLDSLVVSTQCLVGFEELAASSQTFSSLTLNAVCPISYPGLLRLLERNRKGLKTLKFGLFTYEGEEQFSGKTLLQISIIFPRLEKLEIAIGGFEFNIRFGDKGHLEYSKMFPNLKTLSIDYKYYRWNKLKNFYETFFPKQVFNKLLFLRLDFMTLYSHYLNGRGVNILWHAEIFPNARAVQICEGMKISSYY